MVLSTDLATLTALHLGLAMVDLRSEKIDPASVTQISEDVARGKRVYFRGFGSFKKARRPAKKYRNISTGKVETRPPKLDVKFNPEKSFLRRLRTK